MNMLRFPAIVLGTLLSVGLYAQASNDDAHGEHDVAPGISESAQEEAQEGQRDKAAKRHSDRQGREPSDGQPNTLDGDDTPEGEPGDSTDPTDPGGSGGDGRTDPGILN